MGDFGPRVQSFNRARWLSSGELVDNVTAVDNTIFATEMC